LWWGCSFLLWWGWWLGFLRCPSLASKTVTKVKTSTQQKIGHCGCIFPIVFFISLLAHLKTRTGHTLFTSKQRHNELSCLPLLLPNSSSDNKSWIIPFCLKGVRYVTNNSFLCKIFFK
jgi:hypothetical protein